MEYNQESEAVMAVQIPPAEIQEMYNEMVKLGVPPAFAGIILDFRFNPDLGWTFGNIRIDGNPTTCVMFPRAGGGHSVMAVVTDDMRMTHLDGTPLSGPPEKKAMN